MACKYTLLSYSLSRRTPLYDKKANIDILRSKEIKKGDSCNTFIMKLPNHSGTHVDAPRHFLSSGRSICDYSLKELIFNKPFIFNCPKDLNQPIEADDLINIKKNRDFDLLLIRTGFYHYRKNNDIYCNKNPYLSPEAAFWLRNNCPRLRAIGIDCISIASHLHREAGRRSHKILLQRNGFNGPAALILEDMCIPRRIKKLAQVIVAPFFIEGVDSAPCTIIGKYD